MPRHTRRTRTPRRVWLRVAVNSRRITTPGPPQRGEPGVGPPWRPRSRVIRTPFGLYSAHPALTEILADPLVRLVRGTCVDMCAAATRAAAALCVACAHSPRVTCGCARARPQAGASACAPTRERAPHATHATHKAGGARVSSVRERVRDNPAPHRRTRARTTTSLPLSRRKGGRGELPGRNRSQALFSALCTAAPATTQDHGRNVLSAERHHQQGAG